MKSGISVLSIEYIKTKTELSSAILELNKNSPLPDEAITIFSNEEPLQWLNFLKTDTQSLLLNKQLKLMLKIIYTQIEDPYVVETEKNLWQQVMLAIAKNTYYCRSLGYSYFLSFVTNNNMLVEYIVSTSSFILHLEPFHINSLASKMPSYVTELMDLLTEVLEDKEDIILNKGALEENDRGKRCALLAFKMMVVSSKIAALRIMNREYKQVVDLLKREFENDPEFAKNVLNKTNLYVKWYPGNELRAYAQNLCPQKMFVQLKKPKQEPVWRSEDQNDEVDDFVNHIMYKKFEEASSEMEELQQDIDDLTISSSLTPTAYTFSYEDLADDIVIPMKFLEEEGPVFTPKERLSRK